MYDMDRALKIAFHAMWLNTILLKCILEAIEGQIHMFLDIMTLMLSFSHKLLAILTLVTMRSVSADLVSGVHVT